MFGISGTEFLVVAVVMLICVGPKQMPAVFRVVGRVYRRFQRYVCLYRTAVDDALYDADALADRAEKLLAEKETKK